MRKPRKVVPITQGTAKPFPRPGERQATTEEFRILTCRHTPDSLSFHLGPPLLLGHKARKSQPGKLLPFRKSPNGSLNLAASAPGRDRISSAARKIGPCSRLPNQLPC